MAFRFRKSFKVAPGVRLNLSKSGIGMSAGVKGARIGVNSRGTQYTSLNIPGTGISSVSYSKKNKKELFQNTEPTAQDYIMVGKFFLWIIAIGVCIAIPPVGVIVIASFIFYYYRRNKSQKNNLTALQFLGTNFSNKKQQQLDTTGNKEIKGSIGYYGLVNWWLGEFSDDERDLIENTFKPMGSNPDSMPLIQGDLSYSSQSVAGFLHTLAGWFNTPSDRIIAKKIIKKAIELAENGDNILDSHFALQQKMEIYYRERDTVDGSFEEAIETCKSQIKIALKASKQFLKEYPSELLPAHAGYRQLAIIFKKQGEHKKVIELCKQAKGQGWSGDWDKRIDVAQKKLV